MTAAPVSERADDGAEQRVQDLLRQIEERLGRLEQRMAPGPEWRPEPGNVAEEGLLSSFVGLDGAHFAAMSAATGSPLDDLRSGALRPQTWPQLLTCLQIVATEVSVLLDCHDVGPDKARIAAAVEELVAAAGIHG